MAELIYFVHDLADPAVERRVAMLQAGGLTNIQLVGFRRSVQPVSNVSGTPAFDLGQTFDLRLGHRIGAVLNACVRSGRLRAIMQGAGIVIARNLEMLAIAGLARRRFAPDSLFNYECLDIHNVMVQPGPLRSPLRALEQRLLASCSFLIVSSPEFLTRYFKPVHTRLPGVCLLENKVLFSEAANGEVQEGELPPGPPWRVGWFGNLRDVRGFEILDAVARSETRLVDVTLRGRPSRILQSALAEHEALHNFRALGPYDRRSELEAIYSQVHFSWLVTYHQIGFNARVLLANRLYEATLHGCVPIVLQGTAMARWLQERGIGLAVGEPIAETFVQALAELTPDRYAAMRQAVLSRPRSDFVYSEWECKALVQALLGGQPLPPSLSLSALQERTA